MRMTNMQSLSREWVWKAGEGDVLPFLSHGRRFWLARGTDDCELHSLATCYNLNRIHNVHT